MSEAFSLLAVVARKLGIVNGRRMLSLASFIKRFNREEVVLFGLFATALFLLRRNPIQTGIGVAALFLHHRLTLQNLDQNKSLLLLCKQRKHSSKTLHTIKKYLSSGADINSLDSKGRNALILLLDSASLDCDIHFQIIELLIDSGINVNCISNTQLLNALFYLLQNKHCEINATSKAIHLLVNKGLDVNHSNSKGRNALMHLFLTDNPSLSDVAEILINEADINVNHLDNNQENALFAILSNKRLERPEVRKVLNLLIKAGINVNQVNSNGENALCRLFKFRSIPFDGYLEITRKLIYSGADLNCSARHESYRTKSCFGDRFIDYVSSAKTRREPGLIQESLELLGNELSNEILIEICKTSGDVLEIVSLFCRLNVNFNCEDNEGCHPLIALFKNTAARSDVILKTVALLKRKVDVNHVDNHGNNALMAAIETNHYCLLEIVDLLIEETDVHQVNLNGENILIKFCRCLSRTKEMPFFSEEAAVQVVDLLIDRGIDVDHCDENDCNALLALFSSPLNRSILPYIKSCASVLVKSEINLNAVDSLQENVLVKLAKGFNAFDVFEGVIELATFLIESGLNPSVPERESPLLTLLSRARDLNPRTQSIETARAFREALISNQIKRTAKDMKMHKLLSVALTAGLPVNSKNASKENFIEILCGFYQGEDFLDVLKLLCVRGIELESDDGQLWVQIVFCSVHSHDVRKLSEISLLLSERGLTVPALSENCHQRVIAEQVVQDLLN